LYSNKTKEDVVLGDELHKLLGPAYLNVFTREGVIGFREHRIDRKFLIENIGEFNLNFYVCGPKQFTKDLTKDLISLGAKPESIYLLSDFCVCILASKKRVIVQKKLISIHFDNAQCDSSLSGVIFIKD